MSFIANNPLSVPEIKHTPSTPPGTRGLFAKEDGWYEITSDGTTKKIALSSEDLQKIIDELNELKKTVSSLHTKSFVKTTTITLLASDWITDSDNQYSQVITIDGITEYSKIDLQPTPEQLTIFHEKDVTFVTENDDGIVTVYCIGVKPSNDYVIQATVTEVIASS